MKINVYSTHDIKTGIYDHPFYQQNNAVALRSLENHLRRAMQAGQPNELLDHPADFTLFCLGSYDNLTGLFDLLEVPEPVFKVIDVLSSMQADASTMVANDD